MTTTVKLFTVGRTLWTRAQDISRIFGRKNEADPDYKSSYLEFERIAGKETEFSLAFFSSSGVQQQSWFTELKRIENEANTSPSSAEAVERNDELLSVYNEMIADFDALIQKLQNSSSTNVLIATRHMNAISTLKNEIDDQIDVAEKLVNDSNLQDARDVTAILVKLKNLISVVDKLPAYNYEDDIKLINAELSQFTNQLTYHSQQAAMALNKEEEILKSIPEEFFNDPEDDSDSDDQEIQKWRENRAEGLSKFNEAIYLLLRDLMSGANGLRNKILNEINSFMNNDTSGRIQDLMASKASLTTQINSLRNQSITKFSDNSRQLANLEAQLTSKNNEISKLRESMEQLEFFSPSSYADDLDMLMTYVRRYHNSLRTIVSKMTVPDNKENAKELKKLIRQIFLKARNDAGDVFDKLESFFQNRRTSLWSKDRNNTRLTKKAVDSLNELNRVIQDYYTQINFTLDGVHSEIISKIKIGSGGTVESYSLGLLYGLKGFRILSALVAFYIAEKIFADRYRKTAEKDADFIDLRWFTVIFASFHFIFDIIVAWRSTMDTPGNCKYSKIVPGNQMPRVILTYGAEWSPY